MQVRISDRFYVLSEFESLAYNIELTECLGSLHPGVFLVIIYIVIMKYYFSISLATPIKDLQQTSCFTSMTLHLTQKSVIHICTCNIPDIFSLDWRAGNMQVIYNTTASVKRQFEGSCRCVMRRMGWLAG
ncbi:Bgt-20806 [Blumeria graminis f. sp. tritici]|uniref:Bgt-20806 n=2 Tax=Blumeria graminis f. sp. tritici TaxID=62690 RepID=A0A9X9L961_BLUGR|nr:Bgt-20806 [Blumeria graminis f. sp. tritici]